MIALYLFLGFVSGGLFAQYMNYKSLDNEKDIDIRRWEYIKNGVGEFSLVILLVFMACMMIWAISKAAS